MNIAVSSQPSLGGTYTGIEPMGLLWSVLPRKEDLNKYPRFTIHDPKKPSTYKLSMIDGNLEDDTDITQRVLDSLEIERHYLPSYIDMIPVKRGQLKGTLYVPQTNGEIQAGL